MLDDLCIGEPKYEKVKRQPQLMILILYNDANRGGVLRVKIRVW